MVDAWIDKQMVPNQPPKIGSHPRGLYPRVISELEALIAAAEAMQPPPMDKIAAWKAEIAELEKKIDILEQFSKTLP
jgi:hypothetical protein